VEPKVELITTIMGLTELDDALPKPASKFIPDWWRSTPALPTQAFVDGTVVGNVKICPSFPDYFSKGFIIPMWTDSILFVDTDEEGRDIWRWRTSSGLFSWQSHDKYQYLQDVPHTYFGKESYFVFKTRVPWFVFTPEGYSLYQLPPFFHFNEDFSVIPGVRDTDIYHEMNVQLVIHSKKKEIFIPRGTPLAHFIPFKREQVELDIKYADEEDKKRIAAHELNLVTKFSPLVAHKADKKKSRSN
jgi:hypothetical protein